MSRIPHHLVEKIKSIPAKPGVYHMKDMEGNIIYIGKSKTLHSRVKSYFNTKHEWNKIKRMVFHIHDIDVIVTDTHLEAQILECALIQKLQPIYNSQFKKHKNYKYFKIENNNRRKPITIVDEREDENCFGPYRSKNILLEMVKFFENIYPIAKMGKAYEFTYNILPKPMEKDTFEENRNCLIEIFSKKECKLTFLSHLEKKMKLAASEFQFEAAAIYRDVLSYRKYLSDHNIEETSDNQTQKILMGEKIENGYKIFFIADDRIILKKKFQKITTEAIEEFLQQAKELVSVSQIKSEKRNLDFRYIIHAEVKDEASKSILFIDDDYNIDEFIDKLAKIN